MLNLSQSLNGEGLGMERLNDECFCLSLDEEALKTALESELGDAGLAELVRERCPYVFSSRPVFLAQAQIQRMTEVVEAVEEVVSLPAWQERVLAGCSEVSQHAQGESTGVFLGFDFHVRGQNLGLIEINTNAGGAMLNAIMARAQRACCPEMETLVPTLASVLNLEQDIVAMFRQEWALAGQERPLSSIAIVDEVPESQYLYPEFVLFRRLFERHGITSVIVGPEQLALRNGRLWHGELAIDLVYNRLTDFLLEQPAHKVLRSALLEDAAVLTPNPRAHALYADKRNLALLTDETELVSLGVPAHLREVLLRGIPQTELVSPDNAERLWSERRRLFFKPASGYGSKAAYRGDKLTRRVWGEILAGNYVAQALVMPGERRVAPGDDGAALKFDVRNYVYNRQVQWLAARLYQGQTTNFRTPGGGFAPVYGYPGQLEGRR
ncbi:hypothetical protein CLH62_12945 [Marinobacter guineae]|uniref:Circularly permuted ATPgrasp domain-containing protein n=1 Tax=Marinobacter guineae TaxID=432303 RepID=A0A2G1VES6_9GAMM|nr:hypothetical protein [Marinobacter guineae]PHQ25244.1 hypothetical protein CLH62_12945 [Marinobacter guineae]